MNKTTIATLLLALAAHAGAQSLPSQADIGEARKRIDSVMPDIQRLNPLTPAQAQPSTAGQMLPDVPNYSGITQRELMDLSNLKSVPQTKKQERKGSDLMVFVSMSMPEDMLIDYAKQAKRFGAVLMLRGFVDEKLSRTRETLSKFQSYGAAWQINPDAFKLFKIDKVPAIVIATADSESSITEEGCAKPHTYTSVFGDLSLYAALDKMALRGQKETARLAQERLAADRKSGDQSRLN